MQLCMDQNIGLMNGKMEQKMSVAEMVILRWMNGVTREENKK